MRTEQAAKAFMNRWNNTQAGNRESKRVPRAAEGRGTTSSQALPSKLSRALWGLSGHCRPPNSPGTRTLSLSPFTLRGTAFAAPARRNLPARRSRSQGGAWMPSLRPRGSRALASYKRPGGFSCPQQRLAEPQRPSASGVCHAPSSPSHR